MSRDPIAEVIGYNRRFVDRYPDLLRRKIERMSSGAFGFFRGTFHLFARDMVNGVLDPWQNANPFTVVETTLVGDIHSENYGTFKADDGTIRYDINDFDETTAGSFDFDVKRAAASLFLAASAAEIALAQAFEYVEIFVRTYVETIQKFARHGGADKFTYSNDHPPELSAIRRLIHDAADTKRSEFIDSMTVVDHGRRTIKRSAKYFDLRPEHVEQAKRVLEDYVKRLGDRAKHCPGFYEPVDVCGRVAGCGSLGRFRYAVLLEGEGSKDAKNHLLELKEALPSAYDEYRGREETPAAYRERAGKVVQVEQGMQSASNRHLGDAIDGNMSFQVRGIGPHEHRLAWSDLTDRDDFRQLAAIYAKLLAKSHARVDSPAGSGPSGQYTAAALAGREDAFVKRVTAFALAYAQLVEDDQRAFVARHAEVEHELIK